MGSDPFSARRQRGFTMVEVLVSILLTAIATTGILALYLVETRASSYSRHQTEATVLAQDKMESLRTAAAPGVTTTTTETGLNEKGKVVSGGMYTRVATTTPINTSYADVTVTVSWTEDGVAKKVILRSKRNL
jgi:prepilin-type N-terminal cleavage/methylation domain-containing protein